MHLSWGTVPRLVLEGADPPGLGTVGRLMAVECLELGGQVQMALGLHTLGARSVHP